MTTKLATLASPDPPLPSPEGWKWLHVTMWPFLWQVYRNLMTGHYKVLIKSITAQQSCSLCKFASLQISVFYIDWLKFSNFFLFYSRMSLLYNGKLIKCMHFRETFYECPADYTYLNWGQLYKCAVYIQYNSITVYLYQAVKNVQPL